MREEKDDKLFPSQVAIWLTTNIDEEHNREADTE